MRGSANRYSRRRSLVFLNLIFFRIALKKRKIRCASEAADGDYDIAFRFLESRGEIATRRNDFDDDEDDDDDALTERDLVDIIQEVARKKVDDEAKSLRLAAALQTTHDAEVAAVMANEKSGSVFSGRAQNPSLPPRSVGADEQLRMAVKIEAGARGQRAALTKERLERRLAKALDVAREDQFWRSKIN